MKAMRLIALGLLCAASTAQAQTSHDDLDRVVDATMARYKLPGIAVGVIDHGTVVYTATRGELSRGSGQPITRQALFKIASNSKAMTASLLARLVQQGKLRWDDPVTKYLPDFRMHDPWVTEHMQVGDLLTHRSGLPEGGGDLMLWPEPNDFTRADIVHALAYLEPAYDFRAGYAYDNLLYVVAGEVAAKAGGAPYETLMQQEVFKPLGLTGCRVGDWRRSDAGPLAVPHGLRKGVAVPEPEQGDTIRSTTMEAAGGVRCSLDDMLAWARNWLAPDADQLKWLAPDQRDALWTPYTPMPISALRRAWDGTRIYAYGYGWRIADADGELTVSHTGTLSGMYSALMLMPHRQSGFVILINGEADDARAVLTEVLLKHFTTPGGARSVDSYADELAKLESTRAEQHVPDTSSRKPATTRELDSQLGVWRDPWLGDVRLCAGEGHVHWSSVKSPRLTGQVMRVGKRYLVQWDHGIDEAWITFPNAPGAAMRMNKVDPDADFSSDFEDLRFKRVGGCE
ncbi:MULTISPECIES: serine hydrolase domain-containing protein [Dyella]|uniref:Class A beta-lactamase-related serine hydrolase n=2 Tax=Dyella TaxID=231454 RepID=A0A4R0YSP2_9GAMM|nr:MULTISPECIES: serine hydrolase domain-containing protein [Dyella]TBR36822.1 class A beta-lactamase-related serine hydrolase [Dyella terrae]TCI08087.1 class A beta-lactamase-related serine hydrolase [Dyella soli]